MTPQPVTNRANFSFRLDAASPVRLEIFNTAGEKTATLIDRLLPAGEHSVEWNTAQLESGVYLARVIADGTASTVTLVVAR